jgi:hypothetical protein
VRRRQENQPCGLPGKFPPRKCFVKWFGR